MPQYPKPSGQLGPLPIRRKRRATSDDGERKKIVKLSSPESDHASKIQAFAKFKAPADARFFFASNFAAFPARTNVNSRVTFWTDGSLRKRCGGAAVVWRDTGHAANETGTQWATLEKCYPIPTENINAVELLAIVEAMKKALEIVDEASANALSHQEANVLMFEDVMKRYSHQLTKSHAHKLSKEVFIFTDSTNALNMISNFDIRHPRREPLQREQLISIYHLSRQMRRSGIHLEFQWSKGHSSIPGNKLADQRAGILSTQMSKRGYHSLSPSAKEDFVRSIHGR
ncbi:hypothetical protein N7541_003631 [Penicillium brevicompactum]|uniref:RNase H type-1 domain-containing protein n=1 Tax=Penicillium brevicompactum TaxID=5074 RepID=A0A9W9UZ29_PENBR|nr:hypothetical protein N7541_003631 [Penicillium brevicompactum]